MTDSAAASWPQWLTRHLPVLVAMVMIAACLLLPQSLWSRIVAGLGLDGWLSSVETGTGVGADKWLHLAIFFVLTFLVHRSLGALGGLWSSPMRSGLVTVFYGWALELAQALAPGRSADVMDGLADALGAIASVSFIHLATVARFGHNP